MTKRSDNDAFNMREDPSNEDIHSMLGKATLLGKSLEIEGLKINVGITRCFEKRKVNKTTLEFQKKVSEIFIIEAQQSIKTLGYIDYPKVANKLISIPKNEGELLELFALLPQFTVRVNQRRNATYLSETCRKLYCDVINNQMRNS